MEYITRKSIKKWILNYKMKNNFKYTFPHTILYYYNLENETITLQELHSILDEIENDHSDYLHKAIQSLPYNILDLKISWLQKQK